MLLSSEIKLNCIIRLVSSSNLHSLKYANKPFDPEANESTHNFEKTAAHHFRMSGFHMTQVIHNFSAHFSVISTLYWTLLEYSSLTVGIIVLL